MKLKLFLVLLILLIVAFSIPQVKQVLALATQVRPETFTELYFENHATLPRIIRPGQTSGFSFTVRNLESKTVKYPYVVYLTNGIQTFNLDLGTITLADTESKTLKVSFTPKTNIRTQIVVDLVNQNQKISFWMSPQ
jgi:hypothetical protein